MRSGLVVVAIIGLGLVAAAGTKDFVSKAGRFSARFPNEPELREQDLPNNDVKMRAHAFVATAARDEAFMVLYTDVPADGVIDLDNNAFIPGGKVISEKAIKVDGHPAREAEAEMPQDHLIRMRVFAVGHRLYTVAVLFPRAKIHGAAANEFLASFHLTK